MHFRPLTAFCGAVDDLSNDKGGMDLIGALWLACPEIDNVNVSTRASDILFS